MGILTAEYSCRAIKPLPNFFNNPKLFSCHEPNRGLRKHGQLPLISALLEPATRVISEDESADVSNLSASLADPGVFGVSLS